MNVVTWFEENRFMRIVGIVLVIVGIVALLWFYLFAPYCATHICGCTGQGEQYAIVQPLGIISCLIGFTCIV